MNTLDAIQETYAPDIKHWVFLRGLGREQAHWGDFIQRCEAELGWHCHAIDLPGFGSEHHRPSPLTIADIRRDVQRRLPQDITTTGQAFGVVALSLGGMVALDWLAMAPQDITKAIFINSSSADCGLLQRIKPGAITATVHALLATSHAAQESAILKMVSNNKTQHAELLNQWCHIRQLRPSSKRNILRQLIAASQFKSPSVASIANAKGHFISSCADHMVSYQCSEYLANKYHCWLTLHNTAGHDLPVDDAAWLIGVFKTIQG